MSFHLLLLGRDRTTFAPCLWGETGLIYRGLYARLAVGNSNSHGAKSCRHRWEASAVHLVGPPCGYLVFKNVRRAIGDAGRRFSCAGDGQFILVWTAIDWLLIKCRRIDS